MTEQRPTDSSPRDPKSAPRRRRGLPPERPTARPGWILPLVIAIGVVAVLVATYFGGGNEPEERGPVPLYVQVLGPGDLPVKNATVEFFPQSAVEDIALRTETDENGVAELPKEKATEDHFVVARGMNGTISASQVRSGTRGLTPLELLPAERIDGQVVDLRGQPLANVEIEVRFRIAESPLLAKAQSDANGDFRIEGLSGGLRALLFTARTEGYAWQELEWSRHAGDGPRIELPKTVDLSVRIVDSQGEPVVGITAFLRNAGGRQVVSDATGTVRFPGLPAKKPVLLQIQDEARTYRFRSDLMPSRETYEVVLEEPATLEGTVIDAQEKPASGVLIRHRHGPRAWVSTRSGDDGSFSIGDLPSGSVQLEYELEGQSKDTFTVDMPRGRKRTGYILSVR